jgi:hypothetical protein
LGSDAAPVQPIRPIPEQQNRPRPETVETVEEDGTRRSGGVGTATARTARSADTPAGSQSDSADQGPLRATAMAAATAGPTSGYLAQTIAQESIGPGLHIEPWDDALTAYRRADSGPDGPMVRDVKV